RVVALVVGVDHVLVVEREQEGVPALDVAAGIGVDLVVGAAQALVLDDALAPADGLHGEHASAVDGGFAGDDLAGHGRSVAEAARRFSPMGPTCPSPASSVTAAAGMRDTARRPQTGPEATQEYVLGRTTTKAYNFGPI